MQICPKCKLTDILWPKKVKRGRSKSKSFDQIYLSTAPKLSTEEKFKFNSVLTSECFDWKEGQKESSKNGNSK